MIIAGEPLHEPIVQHGPFMMNTKEEFYGTVRDYHDRKNGFERAAHWHSIITRKYQTNKQTNIAWKHIMRTRIIFVQ